MSAAALWTRRSGRGEGPPWLLLHGFLGAPSQWEEVLREGLPGDAFVATLPGHGIPSAPVREGGWREQLEGLWESLPESGPVRLAGYSMGARVALGMAAARPSRCAALVLLGVDPGLESERARAERREEERSWAQTLRAEGVESFVRAWERKPLFASQRELSREVLEAQRRMRCAHEAHALARAVETLGLGAMPPLAGALRELGPRVRLLVGGRDEKFSRRAEALHAEGYAPRAKVLEGAGHNLLLEASQEVARALRAAEVGT